MRKFKDLGALNINSSLYKTRLNSKFANRKPYKVVDPGLVLSFIPGTIVDILVEPGQIVKRDDLLIILDAMKMQNHIKCKVNGVVKSVLVNKGDKVAKGIVLLEIEQG
jgi:biotin carboxyl carrier protein